MFTGWTRVPGSDWHPVVSAPSESQAWDLLRCHVDQLGARFLDTFVGPAGAYPGRRPPASRHRAGNPAPEVETLPRTPRPTLAREQTLLYRHWQQHYSSIPFEEWERRVKASSGMRDADYAHAGAAWQRNAARRHGPLTNPDSPRHPGQS